MHRIPDRRTPRRGELDALKRLHAPSPGRANFEALSTDEQLKAISKMAAAGHSAFTISAATGICADQIKLLLGPRAGKCRGCES